MSDLSLGRNNFGNPANAGNVLTREEANNLLNDWVKNDRLKLHMKQVAAVMRQWAKEKENLDERGNGDGKWLAFFMMPTGTNGQNYIVKR
jgi:predicted hydrolase (HD superfamily)